MATSYRCALTRPVSSSAVQCAVDARRTHAIADKSSFLGSAHLIPAQTLARSTCAECIRSKARRSSLLPAWAPARLHCGLGHRLTCGSSSSVIGLRLPVVSEKSDKHPWSPLTQSNSAPSSPIEMRRLPRPQPGVVCRSLDDVPELLRHLVFRCSLCMLQPELLLSG